METKLLPNPLKEKTAPPVLGKLETQRLASSFHPQRERVALGRLETQTLDLLYGVSSVFYFFKEKKIRPLPSAVKKMQHSHPSFLVTLGRDWPD